MAAGAPFPWDEADWQAVLGVHAPWLTLDRIADDGLLEAHEGIDEDLRRLEQTVADTARELKRTGQAPEQAVERAQRDCEALCAESRAILEAQRRLALQAPSLDPDRQPDAVVNWVTRDPAQWRQSLQDHRRHLDQRRPDLQGPAAEKAFAACERLHDRWSGLLQAHETLGLKAPWMDATSRDLTCARPGGADQLRGQLEEFRRGIEQAEARHPQPRDEFIHQAISNCSALAEETAAIVDQLDARRENRRMITARSPDDIADLPQDPESPRWCVSRRIVRDRADGEEAHDTETGEWAGKTLAFLDEVYRRPSPEADRPVKSQSKADLSKDHDAEVGRIHEGGQVRSADSFPELHREGRKYLTLNCADLLFLSESFLERQHSPVEAAQLIFDLGDGLEHAFLAIGMKPGERLPADMSRWPPHIWIVDRWSGKGGAMPAKNFPAWFLGQMRRWSEQRKSVRSAPHPCEGHRFFRSFREWVDPLDERWAGSFITTLRHVHTGEPVDRRTDADADAARA
jgi:hypothetical protein